MAEEKKKRKFPWGGVIYVAVCMLVGAIIGVVLGMKGVDVQVEPMLFIVIMAAFFVSLYVHIIVHEAGHMAFGLLTGYRFLSYRVGSLMWEKGADGKVRLSRFSLAGTGGQCLMSPPEYNGGDFPYVWYNLGGAVMNFILSALAAVAVVLLPMGKWMSASLWMLIITGVVLGLTNAVPFSGKISNDGSNMVAIGRSPEARRAFWLQMKINEQIAWGIRPRDLPEEYFPIFTGACRSNAMVASMDVFAANRQMDAQNFDKAKALMLPLMDDAHVPGIYKQMMTFDLAWIELITGQTGDMMEKLESKELRQFAKAMKNFPSVLRTQYAVALLRDRDEKKAADIRARFDRMAANYPHESEIAGERELMALTEQKAKEA